MALTVMEATAVNRLLDRLYDGPAYDWLPAPEVTDEQLEVALALLAQHAHNRLQGGWTAAKVTERGLPDRLASATEDG